MYVTYLGRIVDKREEKKQAELNKPTIKDVTLYKMKDPATYNKKNLRVKTNKKVFRTATPEEEQMESPTPNTSKSALTTGCITSQW